MAITIPLNAQQIHTLDLSTACTEIEKQLNFTAFTEVEQQLTFTIDYPLDPTDPRELSEIPEVRLWFIRLDTVYPWLPLLLDWREGELARYVAMLVPHQFHRTEGIQYNPEALEIFVMEKIFVFQTWLGKQDIQARSRLKAFTQVLGYEIDDAFFELLGS